MKVRAISNGNILEESDDYGAYLMTTGLFEAVEEAPKKEDYESWTVEYLRAEAEGLDVSRADGEEGHPLKSDYIRALRKRDRAK